MKDAEIRSPFRLWGRCTGMTARLARFGIGLGVMAALGLPATAETLVVHVRDGQTGMPLGGAFVMVGPFAGHPFAGNVAWTDAGGTVVFEDEILAAPQTVTAGAEGFGFTTVCERAIGEITLPLFPAVLDATMGGTATHVEGVVNNIATVNNDGRFDVALIMPALSVSDYALQDMLPYASQLETVEFPVIGPVQIPSNTYMPDQIELVFIHFSKSPYRIDVPGGRATTFFSVSARVAMSDLVGGTALSNAVVREVGVERDVYVGGPLTLNINSDFDLSQSLTVEFEHVDDGNKVQCGSAALFMAGGRELGIGFDTRFGLVDTVSSFVLSTRAPGGDLSDTYNVAVGTFMDSSAALQYSVGIIDRSGFTPPYTATLDSWMRVPTLHAARRTFSWSDPTTPGLSPSPNWTRTNLGLRAITPLDSTVTQTVNWRIYTAAEPRAFYLPVLPDEAPGPPGGLPDPEDTFAADQLYWSFVATNSPGGLQQIIDDFLQGATHWSGTWVSIDTWFADVAEGELPGAEGIGLRAACNPSEGEVRLTWAGRSDGQGLIELRAADGRIVGRYPVALHAGEWRWRGGTDDGPLPAGVYWATLRQGERILDQARLIWMRSAP